MDGNGIQGKRMIRKYLTRYRKWAQTRAEIEQLQSLSDRELLDIGIRRWDIERVVNDLKAAKDDR